MGIRWMEWGSQGSQIVLLAGSALVAFGLTVLLVGAVQLLRARRRATVHSVDAERPLEPDTAESRAPETVPRATTPRLRVDLGPLDRRLDEIDTRMQQLEDELAALRRAESERAVVRAAEVRANERSASTPEERALRELVARAR